MKQATIERVKEVLHRAINSDEVTGANLLLIHEGKEVFYHQDGFSDNEKTTKINRDTIFRLYSMTKPVTAVATMILMERGCIDLFDPVHNFLPGFKDQKVDVNGQLVQVNRGMTLRELLNMTSGLVYGGDGLAGKQTEALIHEVNNSLLTSDPMTTWEAMNRLGQIPLAFHPGERFQYGTSADVLGAVIEVVSGKSLGEFFEKEIFEPLGMVDTYFRLPEEKTHRLSKVYQGSNLAVSCDLRNIKGFESGGAGLVGTIDDYSKLATMLLQGGEYKGVRLLNNTTCHFLTTACLDQHQQETMVGWNTLSGHSYGNFLRQVRDPKKVGFFSIKGEYGWDGWLGCYFANFPDLNLTFFINDAKS